MNRLIMCVIPFIVAVLIIYCTYIGEKQCVAVLSSSLALYAAKGWMSAERREDLNGAERRE